MKNKPRLTKPKFKLSHNLGEYKVIYHTSYSTVRKCYDLSNSEEEFIERLKEYKAERLIRRKPEGPTEKKIKELHKEFPTIPNNTILDYFYNSDRDVDKVREKILVRLNIEHNQKRINKVLDKYNINYLAFTRRYKALIGVERFAIREVTEENIQIVEDYYRNKKYIEAIRKKTLEYDKIYNFSNESFYKMIIKKFFDGSIFNLNCKDDKEFDILMSDIDYFIIDNYGQPDASNGRKSKRIDTFKDRNVIAIPEYKNLREFYDKVVKGKISYSYINLIHRESSTLDEFLQKVKTGMANSDNYPKDKLEKVNERIQELANRFGVKVDTIRNTMVKYEINRHDLVDDPSLFIILERVYENRRRIHKK